MYRRSVTLVVEVYGDTPTTRFMPISAKR